MRKTRYHLSRGQHSAALFSYRKARVATLCSKSISNSSTRSPFISGISKNTTTNARAESPPTDGRIAYEPVCPVRATFCVGEARGARARRTSTVVRQLRAQGPEFLSACCTRQLHVLIRPTGLPLPSGKSADDREPGGSRRRFSSRC